MRLSHGFALIELLISIAIIMLLSVMTYQTFQVTNSSKVLDTTALNVLTQLREARSLALSSKNAQEWGLHIATSSVTLFESSTYDAGNTTNVVVPLNALVEIASTTLAGGAADVIFQRLSGETDQYGSIVLSLVASSSQQKTITVYQTGTIELQ
ncbi:MAG TPA: prepilin-type N-terminal cleavage/methylation domain-containing protein [Candidatus Paceibacterota bacterium]